MEGLGEESRGVGHRVSARTALEEGGFCHRVENALVQTGGLCANSWPDIHAIHDDVESPSRHKFLGIVHGQAAACAEDVGSALIELSRAFADACPLGRQAVEFSGKGG